jgi:hypothetical protein
MSVIKSISEDANAENMKSVVEGLLPKIMPFIQPMIEGIEKSFGEDEHMLVIRKNKKSGKVVIHAMKTTDVESFKVSKISKSILLDEFLKSLLSGNIDEVLDIKGDNKKS